MMSVDMRVDMRGAVPNEESRGSSCNKNLTVMFERQCQYSLLFGRLEADHCNVCKLQQLGTVCMTSHVTISQASPLLLCMLQAIKNWRWECPGDEATNSGLVPRPSYHPAYDCFQ